ncbi:hypothetical protein [Aliikangiella coralliicola]|uniref:Uncharacterized protein n=1 Tax=Aliikangiella coralliicola TaxID=2592383 RepID=A0A545UFK7_9GAMM|nr:hypothetical protein [Aliikangiella coralliicola]TQV88259.1 hypothetical protein FLL46_06955 [Aliikangiella coralliicola]
MIDTKKQLEKLLREEWHKSFRRYSIYTAIGALLIIAAVAYSTGETMIIEVPVTHIYSEASEDNERFYIIVQLDSLKTKRIRVPRATVVKIGDRVKVIERTTNLFSLKKYTFQMVLQ